MNKQFFFLLFFPVILSSQPVVTQSEPFETSDVTSTVGLMPNGQSDNLLLIYRTMGKNRIGWPGFYYRWAADVISPDLKRLSKNEPKKIEFPDGEDAESGYAIHFGGPGLLFQQHKKKEKKMLVYRCAIEADGTIGKPKLICDYYAWKLDITSKEYRTLSSDSSLLLVAHKPPENAEDEPVSYTIINQEWKQVREGKLGMPSINAEILSGDLFLAADTSIWMPVWLREEDNDDVVRQELWVWRNPAAPPQRIDVSLSDEKIITGMILVQSPHDGYIYLGGAFANASKKVQKSLFKLQFPPLDNAPEQGSFLIKINASGNIESKQAEIFREPTFSYWEVKPADVKKGSGIDLVSPWKIYPKPDGSAWLNLEVFYKTPGSSAGTTGALSHSGFFHSGPIIAVHYGQNGKSSQELLIPKYALSSHGSGMGHLMLFYQGKMAFLYNDNEKNQSREIKDASDLKPGLIADVSGIPRGQKEACSTLFYQDEKNTFKTQKLFNFKETKYWFDPYSVHQISPTSYIIGCDGRSGVFGLLRVDWKE